MNTATRVNGLRTEEEAMKNPNLYDVTKRRGAAYLNGAVTDEQAVEEAKRLSLFTYGQETRPNASLTNTELSEYQKVFIETLKAEGYRCMNPDWSMGRTSEFREGVDAVLKKMHQYVGIIHTTDPELADQLASKRDFSYNLIVEVLEGMKMEDQIALLRTLV